MGTVEGAVEEPLLSQHRGWFGKSAERLYVAEARRPQSKNGVTRLVANVTPSLRRCVNDH
jgi:hypothetical protein